MKDAMKENADKWRENFKKNAAKRLGQRRREQQAGEVGQKAKPRPQEESHDCNEVHPDKTHSKWLKTQNEDTNRYWHKYQRGSMESQVERSTYILCAW